jgi:hypothetical protein
VADGQRKGMRVVDRGNRPVVEDGINICLKRCRPLVGMFAILPAGLMGGNIGLGTLLEGDCEQASKIDPSPAWWINSLARRSASGPHAD